MTDTSWREAASLIMVTRTSVSQKIGGNLSKNLVITARTMQVNQAQQRSVSTLKKIDNIDYRLLMVKRSSLASYMASAYVFPGGKAEMADFSSVWYDVYGKNVNLNEKQLVATISERIEGNRPPMLVKPLTLSDLDRSQYTLPAEIGFRITAIRETFEETGVLLLTDRYSSDYTPTYTFSADLNVNEWRQRIAKEPEQFIQLCALTGLVPDIWSLYEWWNWLTPTSVGHRRFDTMFYVICIDKQPKIALDNTEVIKLKWCSPMEILEEHTNERVFLAPPQVYELSRLHHLKNFNSIKNFIIKREKEGIERWLPVLATFIDGTISLLPGDELYPAEPDIYGVEDVPDYQYDLDYMRKNSNKINRIELRGSICLSLCNRQLTCGHYAPVTYEAQHETLQSML